MKKWTVTVRGTLQFDREVVLFAQTEEAAAEAAEAVIQDAMRKSDEIDIKEIYAEEFEEDEPAKYEFGYFIKTEGKDE